MNDHPRATLALLCLVLLSAGVALCPQAVATGQRGAVHDWARPGRKPLSDARAASLFRHVRESVPANAPANRYVPARSELAAFRGARDSRGRTVVAFNRLMRYVTGRPGLRHPSTDDLIQWVSHKWGIPTDLIRAQLVVESHWRQSFRGDRSSVPSRWYGRYPPQARIRGGDEVYQSLGIAQEKWTPNGDVGVGSEPLRWKSTAFSLDYYAATVRYYFDGACHWCSHGYGRGQTWNSIGAWYSPDPWANDDARRYVGELQGILERRGWPHRGR